MAEPNVDWNIYTNPNKLRKVKTKMVGDDGKLVEVEFEQAGVEELGYVDPANGRLVFASDVKGAPKEPGSAPKRAEVSKGKE